MTEVERSDLENRSTVGGTRGVCANVALEGCSGTVEKNLVTGDEKLEVLLKFVRQLLQFMGILRGRGPRQGCYPFGWQRQKGKVWSSRGTRFGDVRALCMYSIRRRGSNED